MRKLFTEEEYELNREVFKSFVFNIKFLKPPSQIKSEGA